MQNRIVIVGAAGRDFHNFNVCYRDDSWSQVVAFTATQIPDIAGRRYPAELAGPRYPEGIPIVGGRRARENHQGRESKCGGVFIQRRVTRESDESGLAGACGWGGFCVAERGKNDAESEGAGGVGVRDEDGMREKPGVDGAWRNC